MIDSIRNDIRQIFSNGNMVSRLLVINIVIFAVLILLEAFLKNLGFFDPIFQNVALHGLPNKLMFKPWTIFSHMFVHLGFWHLVWNMVGLHLFGRIVGDLLGDQRVLPTYLMGGLAGAIIFVLFAVITHPDYDVTAHGASAAVCALAAVAGIIAPDYEIRLLLIGNVKLKYIVLAFIIMDLVGTQGYSNAGGHYAHLGGTLMGLIIALQLRNGVDLTSWSSVFSKGFQTRKPRSTSKVARKLKVEYKSPTLSGRQSLPDNQEDTNDFEEELNRILDKIKASGYDKLTREEKDFLTNASKR